MNLLCLRVVVLYLSIFTLETFSEEVCVLNSQVHRAIQRQFIPFTDGISDEMVDRETIMNHLSYFYQIIVENKKMSSNPPIQEIQTKILFEDAAKQLPDMKFYFNTLDEPRVLKHFCKPGQNWDSCACDIGFQTYNHGFFIKGNQQGTNKKLAIFGASSIPECFLDIVLPSHFHAFQKMKDVFVKDVTPWSKRSFKAFWRGMATGGSFGLGGDTPHFSLFHRQRLITLCKNIPDCDAEFTGFQTSNPVIYQKMLQTYGLSDMVSMELQSDFKIIIDIDGNSYSGRFPKALSIGVVFKIVVFHDVGTILTKPWEHYVPIRFDLSDFLEKLRWAKQNDEEIERIAKRGRQFVQSRLKYQDYLCYTKEVLLTYHKLMLKGRKLTSNA